MEASRSGRRSVTAWAGGCAALLVVLAMTGTLGTVPAEAVRQSGHWVYNNTLGQVVHVDGGSKHADSTVPVTGVGPANQVTQDAQHGYVIDRRNGRVIVFGKSSLKVESTLSLGTGEQPVVLETLGGPYLVYQRGGTIVRLGQPAASIRAGGRLASAIATTDGTVWVQRGADRLCRLARGQRELSCDVPVPAGHHGTLAAVDDHPVYVDRSAGTVTPVAAGRMGHPVPVDSPDALSAGQVADADAGGRLPVVVAGRSGRPASLVLVDTSTLGSGRHAAAAITVPLGADQYDQPVTTGGAIVVVDRTTHGVLTFDNRGKRTAAVRTSSHGPLRASRGADGRVYVDNSEGTTTYVVDGDGTVTAVDNNRGSGGPGRRDDRDRHDDPTGPAGPPTIGSDPTSPPAQRSSSAPPPPPARPTPPPSTPAGAPPPSGTPSSGAPSNSAPQVPDAPATVTASAAAGRIDVSWFPPAGNGSSITGYRVTWTCSGGSCAGGAREVAAEARSTRLDAVAGARYVVAVAARNGVGLGPSASAAPVVGTPAAPGPLNAHATAADDGSVTVTWTDEPGRWSFTVTTSGGQRVATTSGTRAVVKGLPTGARVRFTVRGREAQGGTVQDSTATVVPFTPASAPTSLGGSVVGENDHVEVHWAAPADLGGGSLAGFRVVAGGASKTVTGMSTSVAADRDGDTSVQVLALTKDPNSGRMLAGPAAARTVHYDAPAPDVALNNGDTTDGHLIIDYEIHTYGLQSSCTLEYESDQTVFWTGTLADGNHRNVDIGPYDIDDGTTIRLRCTTPAGADDDPTVVGD